MALAVDADELEGAGWALAEALDDGTPDDVDAAYARLAKAFGVHLGPLDFAAGGRAKFRIRALVGEAGDMSRCREDQRSSRPSVVVRRQPEAHGWANYVLDRMLLLEDGV